ncbi:hypothetical protein SKAU_G00031740 [Synaphobranchus kaupii]|uniref:Cardiotrophin-like cytokine factor 1 n=1 Tax=Synaphobranchus kaupii TaxID=118154 RepID=A0A9Q1GDS4_SYNKA|nr:hypothetical protein SKAU_G00031740 [Synaphobranchus kaupii]
MRHTKVHHVQLALLLAAVVVSAHVPDPALSLSNERSSIERTYELTKYLEHQLREIKDTYLSYLGPPFSDPDFTPPRPNTTALSLPSAATRLDLWRGLENRARLAQNHRAYSVLLGAVRELARATLCPYLQSSLLHFSAGLDGLLGSISGLMTTLGYSLPPQYYSLATGTVQSAAGSGVMEGATRREREGQRSREERERDPRRDLAKDGASALNPSLSREERGKRGRQQRWEGQINPMDGGKRENEEEEELGEEGELEGWGGRRRLLSLRGEVETDSRRGVAEFGEGYLGSSFHLHDSGRRTLSQMQGADLQGPEPIRVNLTQLLVDEILQSFYSNSNNNVASGNHHLSRENAQDGETHPGLEGPAQDMLELIGRSQAREIGNEGDRGRDDFPSFISPPSLHSRHSRSLPSSLYTSTLHPPLSPLSLVYQFGAREGHTLLSGLTPGGRSLSAPSPLLSALSSAPLLHPPSLNDFSRKVESFWVLRELQSWLWRSAKDFNRLKKKLRA